MDPVKVIKKNTLVISDGGNQLNEIDHTYPAFLASCNRSYDGILSHIRFTKDRYIVCYRHRSLNRLLHQKIHISTNNYRDLLKLDFGRSYSGITLLNEIISLSLQYHKKLYLMLCPPVGILELNQLKEELSLVSDKVSIISNDLKHLSFFRNYFSNMELIYKTDYYDEDLTNQFVKNQYYYLLPFEKVTSAIIEQIHQNGLKVGINKIDNPIDASMMIENQIDFFFTENLE